MDKHYWENYYQSQKQTDPTQSQHSLFAEFVSSYMSRLMGYRECSLLELGCGNGRDSLFFAKNHLEVVAIDQAEGQIASLNAYVTHHPYTCKPTFIAGDFTQLESLDLADGVRQAGGYDCVYSRFTLHSISKIQQDKVLRDCLVYCAEDGILAIEVRGERNALFGKGETVMQDGEIEDNAFNYDGHYRRFLNFSTTCQEIESLRYAGLPLSTQESLSMGSQADGLDSQQLITQENASHKASIIDAVISGGGGYMIALLLPLLYIAHHLVNNLTINLIRMFKLCLALGYFTRVRIGDLHLLMARMITLSALSLKRCVWGCSRFCLFFFESRRAGSLTDLFSIQYLVFAYVLRWIHPRGLAL